MDFLKGFRSYGQWETCWWGCRWTLEHDEVRQIKAKIRQEMILTGSALAIPGTQPVVATLEGLYWVLSSRLEAADKGNGVIVHCPLDYVSPTPIGHVTMTPGFPFNLNWMKNISHIKSR